MPILGNHLDSASFEIRRLRPHNTSPAPTSPTPLKGQMYFDTGDNTLYWFDGTVWQSAKGGVIPSPPNGPAGGDLSGTYPNPDIGAGVIVAADINASLKPSGSAAAGTEALRALGTTPGTAAAGDDARLSNARTPTAHASTHQPGGGDAMAVDAAAATGSLRTVGLATAVQAMPGTTRLDQIANPTAARTMNGQLITGLADPASAQDAATKNYVDNLSQGLDAKASVKAATTANITTLAGGAPNTLDTIALAANDRVLVKDQTTPSQNGIYIVQTLGTGANGTWVRAADMDAWAEVPSAYVWVEQGSTQADTGWVSTADQGGTLGSTSITWTQFSGAGQITAGAGLTKSGNTLNVGAGSGITVNADDIQIANNGVTNAMIADGAINLASADVTGTLPLGNGGTGQTTAKAARETGLAASGYYSSATHGAGTTITITAATHGLRASRGLIVQVQDEATGAVEMPDIVVAANGDVTVTYGAALTANTKRVTVIG